MEDSQSFISGIYQFILGISAGVITTILTTKWLNKEILLTKRLFIQRVAYSSESETWGKIEVLYNGGQSHNLHLITVEIHNESSKNIEELEVVFTLPENNVVYASSGEYKQDEVFTPLYFTAEYYNYFASVIEKNKDLSLLDEIEKSQHQKDVNVVTRQRKYRIPVFNKNGVGIFSFLIDNIGNIEPTLMVSILKKDVRLAPYQEEEERKKTQNKWVTIMNLLFLLIASYAIYLYSTSIMMAVSLMFANIFISYLLAFGLYRTIVWVKNSMN
ncbi:hypothetical protein [Pedobacter sp. UBA4863]|uniref:hypothetical protein n=1 Tax=Pedobacter sp. UBA4863 TaxID=1947060 RepID=UPI0025ECCD5D|nr:hypothetical protein [Pedobacter sp. UBA4863]